jgi:hypothetical protein
MFHFKKSMDICFVCQKNETTELHFYKCGLDYTFFCSSNCLNAYQNAKDLSGKYYAELDNLINGYECGLINQMQYLEKKGFIYYAFKQDTVWNFPEMRN